MEKRVLVLGASEKPERYSNMAIKLLRRNNYPVEAVGLRKGKVGDVEIKDNLDEVSDIHTVTVYLGPKNQSPYYEFLPSLKPKRVIFNPGTENDDLRNKLIEHGIEVVENCTLVMLNYDLF